MGEVSTDVVCQRCRASVKRYEHRVIFEFINGERVMLGDYAALDCGCEVFDYDLRYTDENAADLPTEMVDTLRKTVVLSFKDDGPINEVWDRRDDDLNEGGDED